MKARWTNVVGARSAVHVEDYDALILLYQVTHRRPGVAICVYVYHIREPIDVIHHISEVIPYDVTFLGGGFE